jgi:hypothetical protein
MSIGETKAEAPLIVNSNAPLTTSIAPKRLKSVVGWYAQFVHLANPMKHGEFAQSDCFDVPEPRDTPPVKQRLGVVTSKAPNGHGQY